MRRQLEKYVIRDFSSQYLCGKTPNPCIICNQHIKFGELMKKADALGASYLATGHYCRVSSFGRIFRLKKARDLKKDQSYFLYRLNQAQLSRVVFPLGEYTKDEVRKLAREFSLPVADKIASQEICFLPEDDYRKFLKERLGSKIKPGIVVDRDGKEVGKHKGLAYYTIGQREGLRIALGYPAYIIALDYQDNRIIVGRKEDAFSREFLAGDLSFSAGALKKRVVLQVKIRYNHKESQAQLKPSGNKIRVIFKERQFAVTPGQAAVFYNRGAVIGGGVIEEVLS
jgi:tRNA-specific 2-thiouridylase